MTETKSTVVKVGGVEVDYFISDSDRAMLNVDPHRLDDMWKTQPATVAYFGHLNGRAIAQAGRLKTRRDLTFGVVADELRQRANERGEKLSEVKLESEVRRDRRFIAISDAYNEALGVVTAMEAMNLAARGRKDSLRHFSDKAIAEQNQRAAYRARPSE